VLEHIGRSVKTSLCVPVTAHTSTAAQSEVVAIACLVNKRSVTSRSVLSEHCVLYCVLVVKLTCFSSPCHAWYRIDTNATEVSKEVKVNKMSICRARLRNTFNALTLRMSGEQIRLQVPPKLFGVNSWIVHMIRQWIPECWSEDRRPGVLITAVTGAILDHSRNHFGTC